MTHAYDLRLKEELGRKKTTEGDLKRKGSLMLSSPQLNTLRVHSLIFRRTKHRSTNALINIIVLEMENVKSK